MQVYYEDSAAWYDGVVDGAKKTKTRGVEVAIHFEEEDTFDYVSENSKHLKRRVEGDMGGFSDEVSDGGSDTDDDVVLKFKNRKRKDVPQ